jgi:hypothetical protein
MKTRSMSSDCPLGKWRAIGTQEEEFELNKKLEDEQTDKNI